MANQSLGACFSYTGGSNARADFYLNRAPDWSTHSYSVSLIINGSEKVVKGKTKFGGTGRYCCWYTHVDGQPNRWQTGRTKVVVYTASGGVHFSSLSPVYSFNA